MIDHRNANSYGHIITIEDPIEIIHHDKRALINQREVRIDTADFKVALRAAMRQDPDVILVGELREREVELQRIEAEKALEEQRKNIANVIRERVAVEKTVAQEEERIKEVREVSEAERAKHGERRAARPPRLTQTQCRRWLPTRLTMAPCPAWPSACR